MAEYEAKFTKLSQFTPDLIATEMHKVICFLDGLNPFIWDKISILKLEVYSKVVDRALIAKRGSKEIWKFRNQQQKKGKSNNVDQGGQRHKKLCQSSFKGKGPTQKKDHKLDAHCTKCGKKTWCYDML